MESNKKHRRGPKAVPYQPNKLRRVLTVRMSPELYGLLVGMSDQTKRSMEELVREWITEKLITDGDRNGELVEGEDTE